MINRKNLPGIKGLFMIGIGYFIFLNSARAQEVKKELAACRPIGYEGYKYLYGCPQPPEKNNKHQAYLSLGYSQCLFKSMGKGVYGGLGAYFKVFNKLRAIDIRAKELFTNNAAGKTTAITLTYRTFFHKGVYFGIGAARNYERVLNKFMGEPVTGRKDDGRDNGIVTEIGYDFRSLIKKESATVGVYPEVNVGYSYLLSDKQPGHLLTLSLGLRIGVKKIS